MATAVIVGCQQHQYFRVHARSPLLSFVHFPIEWGRGETITASPLPNRSIRTSPLRHRMFGIYSCAVLKGGEADVFRCMMKLRRVAKRRRGVIRPNCDTNAARRSNERTRFRDNRRIAVLASQLLSKSFVHCIRQMQTWTNTFDVGGRTRSHESASQLPSKAVGKRFKRRDFCSLTTLDGQAVTL
jgi:hypothetical protein